MPDGSSLVQRDDHPLNQEHLGAHWQGANDGRFHFPFSRIILGVNTGESARGAVFLKDLCVFSPDESMRFSLSFKTPYPGNVAFTSRSSVPVTVLVDNRLDEPCQVGLRLGSEEWHGTRRLLPVEVLSLPPRGRRRRILGLEARSPCYYRVSAELLEDNRPVVQGWSGVVVTPKPRNFGVDDPKSFFGIQQTSDGARTERLGVKWVRAGMDWRWGEFIRGKFRFGRLEDIRYNHQLIMFNMSAYLPDWAEKLAGGESFWDGLGSEERIGLWANYVKQAARTLGRYVDTFEIQNEPDLTCMWQIGLSFEAGVERYLKILRSGAAAVRRGMPRARVAGIDVSGGDYDGRLKYSHEVMKHEGDLIDIYTGHPYAGVRYFGEGQQPMWPVKNEERRKCLDTLAMIHQYGGKQRFWVGEKGWGLDVKADPLSPFSRDFAKCLVQSMVIAHSVPGVERYFWFIEEGCNESGYEYGLFRKGRPLPAALAYATLARMLYHARPFQSPDMGKILQAHGFVSSEPCDGTLVLWAEGDHATLTVPCMPTDWRIFDLMGRPLAKGIQRKALCLVLDRSPVYVRFPAVAARSVCGALGTAIIEGAKGDP